MAFVKETELIQETGENFSSVSQCPWRDLRGDCIQKSSRLPTPPSSCLLAAHRIKQQPSLIPIRPSAEALAGQAIPPTGLDPLQLPRSIWEVNSIEACGLMQVNSHIVPVRKGNELQNCIYNMISILLKLDTTFPIHTQK